MPTGTVETARLGTHLRLIVLTGEHDVSTAPSITAALSAGGDAPTVVDLSEASFIDSTVVNALLRPSAASALVAPPGSAPRRILDLLGIASAMPVFESRDEAELALD